MARFACTPSTTFSLLSNNATHLIFFNRSSGYLCYIFFKSTLLFLQNELYVPGILQD